MLVCWPVGLLSVVRCVLFIVCCLSRVDRCSLFAVRCLLSVVRCSLLVVLRVVRALLCVVAGACLLCVV